MPVQVRMQLSEGQAEQLMACRSTMLHELDKLIAGWDQLWADLQVCFSLHITKKGARLPERTYIPACLIYSTGTSPMGGIYEPISYHACQLIVMWRMQNC